MQVKFEEARLLYNYRKSYIGGHLRIPCPVGLFYVRKTGTVQKEKTEGMFQPVLSLHPCLVKTARAGPRASFSFHAR